MDAYVHDENLKKIIFKGYELIGKPAGMSQQMHATRAALASQTCVPIDICIVNDAALTTVAREEGVIYLGRRYVAPNVWYWGNVESAQ